MSRKSKYTKELLETVVQSSVSMLEVLRKLGLRETGGNFRHIQSRIRYVGLSTDHFKGRGWNKGETHKTNSSVRATKEKLRRSNDEVFIENSPEVLGSRITKRLLELGWEYYCRGCKIRDWRDEPLALHLDHINGIRNDNRKENLRWLCPNCHQQTETWGIKNKGAYSNW